MTKEEIISRVDSDNPSIAEIKLWIETMSFCKQVDNIKKGDVIAYSLYKKRPIVVIKIVKDIVYGIPLSTTKDDLNLCSYTSRQFKSGFFSKSIVCMQKEICKNNFIGTLDNNKDLNKAISLLKELIIKF